MAAYNFKKEAKVYVVYNGNQYNIDISEITFSQTFTEESYTNKTICGQEMFEQSIINKANPANFTITLPAIREDDFVVIFDRALDVATFDLYISTQQDVFFIDTCVITSMSLVLEKLRPLGLTVSGEASRLTKAGVFGVFTIPGTPISRDANLTYNRISDLEVTMDSGTYTLSESLTSISVELQNNIEWVPYTTVPGAIAATNAATAQFPSTFTIKKRILAGTITQYVLPTNATLLQDFDNDIDLHIQAGQDVSGTVYGFDINITNCSFTNRLNTGDVFTQSYDWRMTQNPTALSSIFTYTTL